MEQAWEILVRRAKREIIKAEEDLRRKVALLEALQQREIQFPPNRDDRTDQHKLFEESK